MSSTGMRKSDRSVLDDVTTAYGHARERYRQRSGRGDTHGADEALSEMQIIERCVTVHETSPAWRDVVAERQRREAAQR